MNYNNLFVIFLFFSQRVKNWRTNRKLINLQELRQSPSKKKSHCTQCKHLETKKRLDSQKFQMQYQYHLYLYVTAQ
jgi:hypothetical protein